MFISYNKNLIVTAISDTQIEISEQKTKSINKQKVTIGKRMPNAIITPEDFTKKDIKDLRVAIICNWNTNCGISTYSKYLVDEMIPKVSALKIFSEVPEDGQTIDDTGYDVDRCWERGKCLLTLIKKIKEWGADFIIIEHEYGIFPNAFYFMQLCQQFQDTPYVVAVHSVYEHLDKLVYTECIKNVVVHTENKKSVLKKMGNTSNIFVVPHGCVEYPNVEELWNINQNPYTILQFGFGFSYKGVDRALKAIHHLKTTDKKFKNIFYTYLLSENSHNNMTNQAYYDDIMKMVKELDLEENVCIIKKFQTEQMLCLYLRLAKLAIFPYINNPNNTVFSASGAIRIALANKRPVIASESHLFDDFEGIVPRPDSHLELAKEIDKVFSNGEYRDSIIEKSQKYLSETSWNLCAQKYLEIYNKLV